MNRSHGFPLWLYKQLVLNLEGPKINRINRSHGFPLWLYKQLVLNLEGHCGTVVMGLEEGGWFCQA